MVSPARHLRYGVHARPLVVSKCLRHSPFRFHVSALGLARSFDSHGLACSSLAIWCSRSAFGRIEVFAPLSVSLPRIGTRACAFIRLPWPRPLVTCDMVFTLGLWSYRSVCTSRHFVSTHRTGTRVCALIRPPWPRLLVTCVI